MLEWIGELLGGKSRKVSDGARAWGAQLQSVLAPVDKVSGSRAGLTRDIVAFVLSGEPLGVLHELGQRPCVAEHLQLIGYHYGHEKKKASLYQEFEHLPTAVALRWAQVLEASVRNRTDTPYGLALPGGVRWPEILLVHSAGWSLQGWSTALPVAKDLSMAGLEALLVEAGLPVASLVVSAFASPVGANYQAEQRMKMLGGLPGFAESLRREVEAVRPHLLAPLVAQRIHMLGLLDKADAEAAACLAPELCELATVASKQVRAAAEPLVRKFAAAMIPSLQALATNAKPEQRVNALRLLWTLARQLADDGLQAYARTTAAADKAPSAQALLDEWASEGEAASVDAASDAYPYDLPVIEWRDALTPPVSAALDTLWAELGAAVEKANKQASEHHARMVAQGHNWKLRLHEAYSDRDRKELREYIAAPEPALKGGPRDNWNWDLITQPLQRFAVGPGVSPVVVLKTLVFFGLVSGRYVLMPVAVMVINTLFRTSSRPTLLELQQILEPIGVTPAGVLTRYCNAGLARDWPDAAVWPFFAHHLDLLTHYLNPTATKDYGFDRSLLFRAIATLPRPPERVVNVLFDLALGSAKTERPAAQEALAGLPGKEARIINALADGKAEVRAIAAQWLGQLRHAPALVALEQAVVKEKHDVAKGAMLDALQALGQPVEKYLDREALGAEAAKSLAKGLPKDLDWFPWPALPVVRWADSAQPLGDAVLRWLLVQAFKQKTTEPNAVLRKYCAMFAPRDREQFGQFVLEAWLREDVRPIPPEEAMQRAQSQAQSTHSTMLRMPQYYTDDPNFGRSVEELTAIYLPALLRQPVGSAIASKGLLAVAAACAGERAAAPVARYLKEYYGTRAAQGKALIAMLAWIEHPTATQLMLSVGNRFRTKSFQEEATRQAEALAERKGWTLSELADRTIPSGGFDETGTLELSYGQRAFTARLLPDFKVELYNPDGKKISALPEPRQDDDAERAKEAKKAFSAAKKEIKNIVELQTERLYEALCTERDWPFDDWNRYLNGHPVVRRLVQRLVWAQVEPPVGSGRVVRTFRPLDDGSLSDADDNEVELPAAARVRLAHDSLLAAEQVTQWQTHLADYAVVPLFQQLGKGIYALPAEKAQADALEGFEGHLIETFALRGRALKLGYTRGAAEDGGWFYVYEKRFPTLGLVASIEFTGNGLPEENRTVALLKLAFSTTQGSRVALAKVPKVLLSECYNDLRLIAAEGSGYDRDWQKKSEY